jgi:hypothetical protein
MLCAMPVTVRIEGLGQLLDQQLSVVSREQLLGLGMKDNAMQWRIRAGGPWQALLPCSCPPSDGVTASASSGCTVRLRCLCGPFRAVRCGSLRRPAP